MANDKFTKSPAKFLSVFVERMVPDYVREDHPMFITFLRKYFEYLERETGVNGELGEYNQITDLIQNIDVDHALDNFIPEFEAKYLHGTPHTSIDPTVETTDKAFLAKNIQPVYRQKGTTSALEFLFRRDFNTDVDTMYPKQWMMKASGSVWYEPQWITVLTDHAYLDTSSPYFGNTNNSHVAETVRSIYNKKIRGQISGATAFVDMDESVSTTDYERLLLTEVNGVFIKDEEIWEDVGTSGTIPYKALIISDGIRTEGECIVNGHKWTDKWINISGHPNEVHYLHAAGVHREGGSLIKGLTSGATATIDGTDTDWTKFNLLEVSGEFELGEKLFNVAANNYWENPSQSFCSTSTDWPVLHTFSTEIDCVAALHPQGENKASPYFGESAFLSWYPVVDIIKTLQDVEHDILLNVNTPPLTREECDALVNIETQPNVKTAVWKTNGYWLDSGGFLSSDRKLQDNDYYQDFSYVIRSDVPIQSYREVLKKLVHPVGLKLFAEFSFRSTVDLVIELPTDYVKMIIAIFSYLDVAVDIWDQESEQHGSVGRAHTGFGVFIEKGFDEYIIEIMGTLDSRAALITPDNWSAPGEHVGVDIVTDKDDIKTIGTKLTEKLYQINILRDEIKNQINAWPEKMEFEFYNLLRVLPIDEFPPSVTELGIEDNLDNTTDGRMISCDVYELSVFKHLQRVVEWVESFMQEAEYAPEKSYGAFESGREDTLVKKVYGNTNDVIDAVQIQAFDNPNVIHSHGRKNGFAPLVTTSLTKGLELPVMSVGAAAFHVHSFDGSAIPNLMVHGKEATAHGLSYSQARALMTSDAFEIPEFLADEHTTAFLPEATGHVHRFVDGQIVDRDRGRTSDPLSRADARKLIDGDITDVTLYDNIGITTNGVPETDENGVFQGGTVADSNGITSAHYHEYLVTYESDWEMNTDFMGNPCTHGFRYTPVTTWICYNYKPELVVDPSLIDGVDYSGNTMNLGQNVFNELDDATVATAIGEASFTFQHAQTFPATLVPNVDWVELYSSNYIQSVPGSGDTGDLLGDVKMGTGTDIATIVAYPMDPDKICIVDQSGIIHLMDTTSGVKTLFFDYTSLNLTIGVGPFGAYDERGALGLAFHPDYATNGLLYVYYMTEQGPSTGSYGYPLSTSIIAEFTADVAAETVDITTERILITQPQPDMNHNGGQLVFGPDDYLYIGFGDGGAAGDTGWTSNNTQAGFGHGVYGNAQNPTNLLGTILRIDVAPDTVNNQPYSIPSDNPFTGVNAKPHGTAGAMFREEIWAYGLRNPWRFSFAPDGKLWAADVGQNKFEEVNIIEKGGNYGWRVMEAYHYFEEDQATIDQMALDQGYANTQAFLLDLKSPIHEYSHGTGISILGGFIYRGSDLTGLQGKFIFGDWSTTWAGTTGHLFSLEENPAGLSAHFTITPNAVNGANHSHEAILTPSQVALAQANPGTPIIVVQSDTVHAESYTHTFSIIWNATFNTWNLIAQTNMENHDVFTFIEYSGDVGYTRKNLSFWDPATSILNLTTHDQSILTLGEDTNGELYMATRIGIDSYQGTGPQNCDIYKLTDTYDSSTETGASSQIPASETAHVHGYKVVYDINTELFSALEISDIEMTDWDAFFPIWTYNTPVSHLHPVITSWTGIVDENILLGSSAGWHLNPTTLVWEPYDTGSDTPYLAVDDDEDDGTFYIATAPVVEILGANEYGENAHIHYFNSEALDTFGANDGRTAIPITRIQAEDLANGVVNAFYVYSSIEDSGQHLHYHVYKIMWNLSTQQFVADEMAEMWDENTTGEWEAVETHLRTHEHTLLVNGITTHLGWNGTPLYTAPDVTLSNAHDWHKLEGSEPDHLHAFNSTVLDTLGTHTGREALPLDDNQATDLINGEVAEIKTYTSISGGDHYHGVTITYDANTLSFVALDTEKWESSDGHQFYAADPRSHAHPTNISNLFSRPGYNEMMEILPTFASPGYPYPGGSHPHFHNDTVVGPFAEGALTGQISYAHGMTIAQGMQLIDGVVDSVTIYDSIEGAHFHEYRIKWDTNYNIFYAFWSVTWIKGGIEDSLQDPAKYYVSVVENAAEGLHWHNLTIEWNPNLVTIPQQTGGSIYITKTTSTDEVLSAAPSVVVTQTSTELLPVTTTYPDTPQTGDTTIIVTYSDLITTITTSTVVVTTTTTDIVYYSDYGTATTVGSPVITSEVTTSQTTAEVEDLTERKTYVNTVLQANNPPIVQMQPSFIAGIGSHDHLLYEGCTLDSAGTNVGRTCEPITLAQANDLINAQNANYGIIFFDSPNGASSHYHGYTIKFNPNMGAKGTFVVAGISQWDIIPGTSTYVHKFSLTGGFHDHDYWISVADYTSLIGGTYVTTPQRDSTHAAVYTHELVLEWNGSTYNIISQTSDYDNHDTISYLGSIPIGGQWSQNTQGSGAGDHVHSTTVDDTNVWPVPA